jgi:guanylate kinase
MPHEGILFVLVGPSGAGKNTLMQRVKGHFDNLTQLATMTTRSMREGEAQGREHWFVSPDEFTSMIERNQLVEWQRVHLDDLYGTPRKTVDEALIASHDLIADIECLGAEQIQKAYPYNAVLIFITPSSLDILAQRILKRTPDIEPKELAHRLERAKFEMTFAPQCTYLVLNDDVEQATVQLRHIIASERLRRRGEDASDGPIIPRHVFHIRTVGLIRAGEHLLTLDGELPDFGVRDYDELPHVALQRAIEQALGQPPLLEEVADSRFDFTAPSHVSIIARPPDIHLTFYYRGSLPTPDAVSQPDWAWRSPATLDLAPAVTELLVTP